MQKIQRVIVALGVMLAVVLGMLVSPTEVRAAVPPSGVIAAKGEQVSVQLSTTDKLISFNNTGFLPAIIQVTLPKYGNVDLTMDGYEKFKGVRLNNEEGKATFLLRQGLNVKFDIK